MRPVAVRVKIPRALERYVPQRDLPQREIAVEATTVREALEALPGELRARVLDGRGALFPHLLLFLNDEEAEVDGVLGDNDLVEIVGAVEGG